MATTLEVEKNQKQDDDDDDDDKNSPFSSSSSSNIIEEDRISELPDSLIHHILSFLDTKYVIQTSVLSKRWRPLCTSIPTLNFNDYMFRPTKSGFIIFVDTVLINRGYFDIRRFRLNCRLFTGKRIRTCINTWINAAVRRNVRRLCIEMHLDPNFQFPASLFTSTSLRNLDFSISGVDGQFPKLVLPTSVNLPNLKCLKLSGLSIVDNLSNKFFSNCPALKTLILKNCHVEDSDMNFGISCPNLLGLVIENLHIPQGSRVKNVKLYAPKLLFFTCNDSMAIEYDLGSLDHLKSAEFLTLPDKNSLPKNIYARRIMNFLRVVHNVNDLKLSSCFLEGTMGNPERMKEPPIQFCNLQSLVLETFLSNDSFYAITHLLKISPNIKSLSLSIVDWTEPEGPQSPYVDEVTLPCMLHHLEVVEINKLWGCDNELKLLEILLKNSVVLEKVILSPSYGFTEERSNKFREMLPTFQRPIGAATPMILFNP